MYRTDFELLAAKPIWEHQKLQTLLTHAELSHYTVHELINWKVDPNLFRDFVLSPMIVGPKSRGSISQVQPTGELDWRRELWESFWPQVRREDDAEAAAEILVRSLRQRVTIVPSFSQQAGIESIWRSRVANVGDFELVYTAALRSVGVPAKLDANNRTEFWDGTGWHPAPRPLIETWLPE